MSEVENAEAELAAARKELNSAHSAKSEAIAAVEREHRPIIAAAQQRQDAAVCAHLEAVRNATPDHPLHGKRVFWMKPIFKYRWSREPERHERIEGEIRTYRPGDNKPPYHSVSVGDPLVFLILKSGKLGVKPEPYHGKDWQPVKDPAHDPQ